ncbi:phospho-2-dehydro-3-deoxyheptonate aldolase [Vibrio coralliilyticus]|uniref:Phospho-2-dehydro-3-deoxyheptonate aldolase n=1 Tax=Vibrio coralliilyticus TaxID=190893 RepID=A0A7M2K9I9_9VIBR|nr:3-deoxy-7-phosphoheptulonate synthase [Vibrio coralliilyticus]KJY70108.1 phospho-2-dehydro-3-deoxyheptonate aldolase [Vibrio coralliilyticus]QOU32521.1 3-deoxy-7-phosphoheptulonate synthase [Vibrio coralliilyticus]
MSMLSNIFHAKSFTPLPSFKEIRSPIGMSQRRFIHQQREQIQQILEGRDPRLLVIVGPCSIHDPNAALEYANKLAAIQRDFAPTLKIVMRTYFEKPRTRVGWKGFVVDPDLDGQHNIAQGIKLTRELLASILDLQLPTATEFLDPNFAPYFADMICWGAIGARTTESQPHRQLVSGLRCPVGFKNSTDGNIDIAVDAIHASRMPHSFIQCGDDGTHVVVHSEGNQHGHLILRGGHSPNYAQSHIQAAASTLKRNDLAAKLLVDFSHGNSQKVAQNQLKVADDIAEQIRSGDDHIAGVMCESFLQSGQQSVHQRPFNYGQSITDECLNWQDTVHLLRVLHHACLDRMKLRQPATA